MEISVETIDQINILNASLKAMGDCFNLCNRLTSKKKGLVVVDGNKKIKDLPLEIDQAVLVKGDQKVALISLASILAKTYRDQIMEELNLIHPEYGWDRNAGYPTKLHREALRKQGPTPHHRKTFRGVFELL